MKRPHFSATPAALAFLFAVSMPCHAQSLLGNTDTAIVDENNKVVGKGPQFGVALGVPATEGDLPPGGDQYLAAMKWLQSFIEQLNGLERDSVAIRMALRTAALSIREWADFVKQLRQTRDKLPGLKEFNDKLIAENVAHIEELKREQDQLIGDAMKRWDDLLGSLDKKIEESGDLPQFQSTLESLRNVVKKKRQLGEMELYLSAGQSRHFRTLARRAASDSELAQPVLVMQVMDYLDQSDTRMALYAARKGQQLYPDNPVFGHFAQGLEASYLQMISAKALDDGAQLHSAWNEYVGSRGESTVRDFFFGGLSKTVQSYLGTADALEELSGNAHDRAIMEHNGIEVIRRLHEKGLSFDEIKGLSSQQLRDRMNELFGLKKPLDLDTARGMALAVRAAFHNDDVKRLWKQTKEQFDVDLGRSNLALEAFNVDEEWSSYALDAVNAKNAILFFGPSAVVRYAKSAPGWAARVSRGVVPTRQFEGAVTARDWLLARPSFEQAARWIGSTKAGQTAGKALETLRYLRYDASGPVRFATGVTEALAEIALFEGASHAGRSLGGEWGQFLGEALAALGANPTEVLQRRHTTALEETAEVMAKARRKWQATNEILSDIRVPVRKSVGKLKAGETLTAADTVALEAAAREADTVAAQVRRELSDTQPAGILTGAADEAEALANAARSASKGDTVVAGAADDIAGKLEREAVQGAKTWERGEGTVLSAERTVAGSDTVRTPPSARGTVRTEAGTLPKKKALSQTVDALEETIDTPVGQGPPRSPPQGPRPPTAKQLESLGDEAMAAKRWGEAEAHYRAAMSDSATTAEQKAFYANRVREAKQAAKYEKIHAVRRQRGQTEGWADEADEAMKPFSQEQRDYMRQLPEEKVVKIEGTAGAPRKILGPDGEVIAIWKPKGHAPDLVQKMTTDGQLIGEVAASRAGRMLGVRIPHAEPWTLETVNAAGQVVREEGVMLRFVPGTKPLGSLSTGSRAVLKDQVARIRAVHVLTGNYDVHLQNYLVDRAGNVWGIDFGLSAVKTPTGTPREAIDMLTRMRRHAPEVRRFETGDTPRDWDRFIRDWYNEHPFAPARANISRLDDLVRRSDMDDVVGRIKNLDDAQIDDIIDTAMPGHVDAEAAKQTWKRRRDNIDDLLDRWPEGAGTPGPQSRVLEFPGRPPASAEETGLARAA